VIYGDKHVLSFVEGHVLGERRAQPRRAVAGGGEVVAEGTPEQVAQEPRSDTGGYLKDLLSKSVRAERVEATSSKKKRASSASVRQREAAE
jgi:hypothetical protein